MGWQFSIVNGLQSHQKHPLHRNLFILKNPNKCSELVILQEYSQDLRGLCPYQAVREKYFLGKID